MNVVEIENVTVKFADKVVLKEFNLAIEEGETVVLAGPSGTGKSVLLKLCEGLLTPTSGTIRILGRDITTLDEKEMNALRAQMGMLFQNYGLFDSMNIAENVGFMLKRIGHISSDDILERVRMVLSQVDLHNVEHLKPVELSGGMKKRVGIARAIVHKPKVVFYDEPTAGLDPVTADLINDLILEMERSYGVTSLSVSNEMSCACKIGDRIGILYNGEMVEIDTPDKIMNSKNPIVHQFVNGLEEGPIKVL